MREIKFRLWSKNTKSMVSWEQLLQHARNFTSFDNLISHFNNPKAGVLMQYTGLKDKNVTEIYEGDVVECTHWFFDGNEIEENFRAYVGFNNGNFSLEGIRSRFYSDYTGEDNGEGICWIGLINYVEEDYEVIGNIYENPELLKEVALDEKRT